MQNTKAENRAALVLLQLAVILGFILQSSLADGQNLLANPGFETGSTTGWGGFGSPTLSVETTLIHSGVYAVLVTNRTGTFAGISQSLMPFLQSSRTYNISAWVRLASGTSQNMQLTVQQI